MTEPVSKAPRKHSEGFDLRGILFGVMNGLLDNGGRIWVRHGALLGFLMLACFIALTQVIAWLRPVQTWDMIAYLAAAWKHEFPTAEALHAYVWETIRLGTSPEHFQALSEGDAYRARQFADPVAFNSMLGMYEVKWLYVRLVELIAPVVGPLHAGFVINLAAAAGFLGVLSWWLISVGAMSFAPLVVALLIVAGFPQMAMAETPDLACTALMLAGVLFIDRGRVLAGCIALVLAVGMRPDMVAFVGVLMACGWLWSQRNVLALAATFAVATVLYLIVTKLAAHPGWWPHLWFSTYQSQLTMQDFDPAFSLKVYLTAFLWNVIRSAFEGTWLGIYMALLTGWAIMQSSGLRIPAQRQTLIAAMMLAVAAKFVLFPLHDGRVYIPLLIPAVLLLFAAARHTLNARLTKTRSTS